MKAYSLKTEHRIEDGIEFFERHYINSKGIIQKTGVGKTEAEAKADLKAKFEAGFAKRAA